MANVAMTSLNGGEASQKIDCRTDIEKYLSLCRHLENMLVTIYGGVEKRPGTLFINKAEIPT